MELTQCISSVQDFCQANPIYIQLDEGMIRDE